MKRLIWLGLIIGGFIGSYIPLLWGGSTFSFASVILSGVGSLIGIWIAFKIEG